MQPAIDKNLVRQRFRKCLDTYDAHATVQRRMAGKLVQDLIAHRGDSFSGVLEIGSGTGLLTRQLLERLSMRALWTNDLVSECRRHSETLAREFPSVSVNFVPGDIEDIAGLPSGLDLIVSNAAFQWIQDLPGLLERLSVLLAPAGLLAFSTFGPDNLTEVREATGATLPYHDIRTLRDMPPAGMRVLSVEDARTTLPFASPRDVLDHIRRTGSNALATKQWTRKSLAEFEINYPVSSQSGSGVTLTYHPIIVLAGKVPMPNDSGSQSTAPDRSIPKQT
jgi:malonyl-CoA O-methyltransferase